MPPAPTPAHPGPNCFTCQKATQSTHTRGGIGGFRGRAARMRSRQGGRGDSVFALRVRACVRACRSACMNVRKDVSHFTCAPVDERARCVYLRARYPTDTASAYPGDDRCQTRRLVANAVKIFGEIELMICAQTCVQAKAQYPVLGTNCKGLPAISEDYFQVHKY